jgi:hypothetical protein
VGLITSWPVLVAGGVISGVALIGWIRQSLEELA